MEREKRGSKKRSKGTRKSKKSKDLDAVKSGMHLKLLEIYKNNNLHCTHDFAN